MTSKLQTYLKHKPSGIDWLGDIPTGWDVKPLLYFAHDNHKQNLGEVNDEVLSLSYGRVIKKEKIDGGLLPASFSTYQVMESGDIVMRLTDLQNDHVSLRTGLVTMPGIITSAYLALKIRKEKISEKFLHWLLHSYDLLKVFYNRGGGVRQSIGFPDLKWLPILLPDEKIQKQIADFLDEKTKVIDELVAKKEKLIELLREKRAALITHAVTKDLDPNAKLKPSGIDWLGDIPEGWEVKRIKFVARLYTGNSISDDRKPEFLVENDGYPYISSKDIDVNYSIIDYENGMYIPRNSKEFNVAPTGSILLCVEGGSAGRKIAYTNCEVCFVNKLCCITSKKINNRYIFYFCRSKNVQDHFEASISGLIGGVSIKRLRDFFCLQPTNVKQKQIADFLDTETGRIDKAVTLIESQIEKLKEYRSSLIYSAVTGKMKI